MKTFKFRVLFEINFLTEFHVLQNFNVEVLPQASWRFLDGTPEKTKVEMRCDLQRETWPEATNAVLAVLEKAFPERFFDFVKISESDPGRYPSWYRRSDLNEETV